MLATSVCFLVFEFSRYVTVLNWKKASNDWQLLHWKWTQQLTFGKPNRQVKSLTMEAPESYVNFLGGRE
jgi:hypothetical protein